VGEGRAYGNLGNAYKDLGGYHQAINYYDKYLNIMQELRDQIGEGRAYGNLGNAYQNLGETRVAINYYDKYLKIAQEFKDQVGKGRAYGNLGNAYKDLGEHRKAIGFHEKALIIAVELQDRAGEGRAYGNLGNAYGGLEEYRKAIDFHKKALKIAIELQDRVSEGRAWSDLGNAYKELGEYHKAIESQERDLGIALELNNYIGEGRAYSNLGNTYDSLGEYRKAIDYHRKALKIAVELKDRLGEGRAYSNLGNSYHVLGDYQQAIGCYTHILKIAIDLQDQIGQGIAYCNLGNVYHTLGEYKKAVDNHQKDLQLALKLQDRAGEGMAYCNLGNAYSALREYHQAEEYFRKGIEIDHFFQENVKEAQWQIVSFERWSAPYINLERILLSQNKSAEALEISDRRRSRALSSLLSKKLLLKEKQGMFTPFLSFKEMQRLAQRFHTTFIVYSIISLDEEKASIHTWIVSPNKGSCESITLSISDSEYLRTDKIFEKYPYQLGTKRPTRNSKPPSQFFKENLSCWYDYFIAPLEAYLPLEDSGETLTFIPEGFLTHLPFGAFYNSKKDKYLIEKYPVSIAPSIQVLSLLDQFPKEATNQALLIGNPTTPQQKDNQLKYSEHEVRDILEPLMNASHNQVFIQKDATVNNILKYAPEAQWIHLSCHRAIDQNPNKKTNPYSIFEGFFKLAPDEEHPLGHLYSEEINSMALKASLVFMSTCHLGRGNLQNEESIGSLWSFLSAGARSTIAGYWAPSDGYSTLKMVETFYKYLFGIGTYKINKARALQQAIIEVMKEERDNPHRWGVFFLSGLIE
ncbi:MAG: tetratricopeptide repeat protein, partial [Candidatus Rhabdochlamydia sp.]